MKWFPLLLSIPILTSHRVTYNFKIPHLFKDAMPFTIHLRQLDQDKMSNWIKNELLNQNNRKVVWTIVCHNFTQIIQPTISFFEHFTLNIFIEGKYPPNYLSDYHSLLLRKNAYPRRDWRHSGFIYIRQSCSRDVLNIHRNYMPIRIFIHFVNCPQFSVSKFPNALLVTGRHRKEIALKLPRDVPFLSSLKTTPKSLTDQLPPVFTLVRGDYLTMFEYPYCL